MTDTPVTSTMDMSIPRPTAMPLCKAVRTESSVANAATIAVASAEDIVRPKFPVKTVAVAAVPLATVVPSVAPVVTSGAEVVVAEVDVGLAVVLVRLTPDSDVVVAVDAEAVVGEAVVALPLDVIVVAEAVVGLAVVVILTVVAEAVVPAAVPLTFDAAVVGEAVVVIVSLVGAIVPVAPDVVVADAFVSLVVFAKPIVDDEATNIQNRRLSALMVPMANLCR